MMVTVIGNGLENYLLRRTRKQAMDEIAGAEHEAAELVAQAAEEAEKLHGGAEAEARDKVQALRRRLVARAELEAREALLRAQEEMLERVWRVAGERLATLDAASTPEQRLARLHALALEAATQLGGGDLTIQVNERDADLLTPEVLESWAQAWHERLPGVRLTLADEPATIVGGLVVRSAGSRELVDNSYEQRLAVARETLRGAVMAILTEEA